MTFGQWKRDLMKLFPRKNFIVPGNDWLQIRYEAGHSVQVVAKMIRDMRERQRLGNDTDR